MQVKNEVLKRTIVQETIMTLVDHGLMKEARDMHLKNKEYLDEAWLRDLIDKISGKQRDDGAKAKWQDIEQTLGDDEKEEDRLEKMVAKISKGLVDRGQYGKKEAAEIAQKFRASAPGLDRNTYQIIGDILYDIGDNPSVVKQVVGAAAKEGDLDTHDFLGQPGARPETKGAGEAGAEKKKPATVSNTVKDLAGVLRDPAERALLLKGLYRLMINKSVLGAIKALPDGQGDEVKNLLVQMMEMDPKALADVRAKVGDEFEAEALDTKYLHKGSGRASSYGAQFAARQSGMQKQTSAEKAAGLKLKESKNSNFRAKAERAIILEILGLYIERKTNKII